MLKLKKIWQFRWVFRSLLQTIYFNFHYLPFKQAIKLPILLYKPHLKKLKGTITIDCAVHPGMIILGKHTVSIYPNNGIMFENHGGGIIFYGECSIGNNSAISIGSNAKLFIGKNFSASTSLKLVCYHYIKLGQDVLIGWNNVFMDTDFHSMKKIGDGSHTKGYGSIIIGDNNWFGMNCVIMKNTCTPNYCTIAGASLLNKNYTDFPEYSIIGSDKHISLLKTGIYRDFTDDSINYENN